MKCNKCKMHIDNLNFDVTAGCGAQLFASDEYADYDISCLTDCVTFNNFRCPECDAKFTDSEDEAKELLKK